MGHIWCDPDGQLHLFFSQSMMAFDGRASTWESICERPDSDHPIWSKPRWIWHGGVHNKPIVRKNGEWLLPLDLEIDGYGFYRSVFTDLDIVRGMHIFASTDRGKTWRRRGHAVPQGVNHYAEHMVVERSNGSLWMLIRTDAGLMESISTDDGWTWSEPAFTKNIKQPCSRFFITRLVSGRLMMVKHGNTVGDYIETEGLPSCVMGRNRLTAFLSDDDGITWQGGLMLDERQTVSYPDGFQTPEETIYIAYDHNRATDAEILMAKFTEEDILAGKSVSPESILKSLICKPST